MHCTQVLLEFELQTNMMLQVSISLGATVAQSI